MHLKRPTRKQREPRHCFPIWSCSKWGLPCRYGYPYRGALLPHHFTLTIKSMWVRPFALTPYKTYGGIFSAALSVGSRPPGVTWHFALWSPDFPPASNDASDYLADLCGFYGITGSESMSIS